jgi:hypothetical protein
MGEKNKMGCVNCWDLIKCGREPGGSKIAELGVCPAASDTSSNEINHGKNGGRICWAIAGTLCGGKVQGNLAQKQVSCMVCKVFKQIKAEEGSEFVLLKPWQAYMTAS